MLCDEHGIGGGGEYFGDNDAHLDINNFFYHEASGGKYLPRAVLFDLEPGVVDAVRASSLGCLIRPGINLVGKTGLKTTTKELSINSNPLPLSARCPGTPNVILIAATLVFLKKAAIARLLRGVILYDL